MKRARVFMSYSWKDKPAARRLEEALSRIGVDVWVDHERVRGGDPLARSLSDGLEWCDTLLLVWSAAASSSEWVEREWSAALSRRKRIVPCMLDDARVPALLANYVAVDLRDFEAGVGELEKALVGSTKRGSSGRKTKVDKAAGKEDSGPPAGGVSVTGSSNVVIVTGNNTKVNQIRQISGKKK
jgi:hypothetical protein